MGPYTAAAITSISFGAPAVCVDGNVVRILARLTADATPFRDSASSAKAFTPLATALLSTSHPGDHNQAMMELGATVCFRQNPLCTHCPVLPFCTVGQRGDTRGYPNLTAKKMEQVAVTRVWCERKDSLLLHLSAKTARRFANMHELPTAAQAGLAEAQVAQGQVLAKKRRSITRYQIIESIHVAPAPRGKLPAGLVWVPLADLDTLTLSGPHRRWVKEILGESTSRDPSSR